MKKLALLFIMSLVVFSCSKDETSLTENQENLVHEINTDLRKQIPNKAYDNDVRGTYAGVIVANNAQFHGKLWVNIGNDGNTNALVETINGELINFSLADNATSISSNYIFENSRGSFEVNVSDFENVVISNISIDNTNGDAFVMKERNGNKRMVTLGVYDNGIAGSTTGTWDIMTAGAGGFEFLDAVMITGAGGGMQTELAVDFEAGDPGCYGGGAIAPFFWDDAASNKYELYATGQTIAIAGGTSVVYDFGFGKDVCDLNGLTYDTGLFSPEATSGTNIWGGTPPAVPGCYSWTGFYGLYVWLDTDGITIKSAGFINFTLPDFAALGYPANCSNGIMDGDETGVDCGGTYCPVCPDPLNEDTTLNKTIDTPFNTIELATPAGLK